MRLVLRNFRCCNTSRTALLIAVVGLFAFWGVILLKETEHLTDSANSRSNPFNRNEKDRAFSIVESYFKVNDSPSVRQQPDNGCTQLRKLVSPKAEVKPVTGKFMEKMDPPRELAVYTLTPWAVVAAAVDKRCTNGTNQGSISWSMVSLVKSSLTNRGRRDAIRNTWGSVKILDGVRFEVVFVLGQTNGNSTLQRLIENEAKLYGDLLQFNMNDTSEWVPEKVLAGMQWASQSFPPDWIYTSVDDDIVLNLPKLVAYFNDDLLRTESNVESSGVKLRPCIEDLPLVCVYSYQPTDKPARNNSSKWYMPLELFPNKEWPIYCRGGMYSAPVKMVTDLFAASRNTHHLYLDDVWITGFMRRKLGKDDMNIMAAPRSERSDELLMDEATGIENVDEALTQHLWGNINFKVIDVTARIFEIWGAWKTSLARHHVCSVVTGSATET